MTVADPKSYVEVRWAYIRALTKILQMVLMKKATTKMTKILKIKMMMMMIATILIQIQFSNVLRLHLPLRVRDLQLLLLHRTPLQRKLRSQIAFLASLVGLMFN